MASYQDLSSHQAVGSETYFQLSESTIYRKISDELVVIQLETGHFFYFSDNTELFLQFFSEPNPVSALIQHQTVRGATGEEVDYLRRFCGFLLKNKILKQVAPTESVSEQIPQSDKLPYFLREGEKTLDEITFLCP